MNKRYGTLVLLLMIFARSYKTRSTGTELAMMKKDAQSSQSHQTHMEVENESVRYC